MRSFEEYWEETVNSIIESSEELVDRGLDQTQSRLHSLIMTVFSFSANATSKLDKKTQESMRPLVKVIEDHLRQITKLEDTDL